MRLGCAALAMTLAPSPTAAAGEARDQPSRANAARLVNGTRARPSPSTLSEARERFDRGLELYREGDHALALVEFLRAHELVPNYRVLYNIGQVSIQLGQYARARLALREYLELGGSEVSHARRVAVAEDLQMLKKRTAFLTIEANVPAAEVLVDDASIGGAWRQGPLLVNAGPHRILVRHADYSPEAQQIALAGGDHRALRITLQERGTKTIVVREAPWRPSDALMIGGWVATGVLAAGAIFTGVLGASKARELDEIRKGDELQVPDLASQIDGARSSARSLFVLSDVMSGAAAVVGGLSLWMTLGSTASAEPSSSLRLGYERGAVRLAGSF